LPLVLKRLGSDPENPFTIGAGIRHKLLSVVAEVAWGVDSERKGASGNEISTPTGGKNRR
jgi:hypothetical protein